VSKSDCVCTTQLHWRQTPTKAERQPRAERSGTALVGGPGASPQRNAAESLVGLMLVLCTSKILAQLNSNARAILLAIVETVRKSRGGVGAAENFTAAL